MAIKTRKKNQRMEEIKSHIFSTNHDLNDFQNAQTQINHQSGKLAEMKRKMEHIMI